MLPSSDGDSGLVVLEALAYGIPVTALPFAGPSDVIGNSRAGVLDWDLRAAAIAALAIPREICRSRAMRLTWCRSIEQFLDHVAPVYKTHTGMRTFTAPSTAAVA